MRVRNSFAVYSPTRFSPGMFIRRGNPAPVRRETAAKPGSLPKFRRDPHAGPAGVGRPARCAGRQRPASLTEQTGLDVPRTSFDALWIVTVQAPQHLDAYMVQSGPECHLLTSRGMVPASSNGSR